MLGSTRADLAPRCQRRPCGRAPFAIDRHLRHIIEHTVAPPLAVAQAALWRSTRGSPAEAFARQIAMYLAHVGLGLNLTAVGRLFGRDRRTVAHACAVVEDRRDAAALDRVLDLLEGALRLLAQRQA
jgi:chromosomal replication initiation ATPase DnaA